MFSKFKKKFGGKHRQMESFTALFTVLCVSFLAVTGYGVGQHLHDESVAKTKRVLYTTEFKTSRSQIDGSVMDVFRNKDFTKAVVLFKFNNPKLISTDANDYTLYLVGMDDYDNYETVKDNVDACVYSFGNSGYMAVYMVNPKGFPNQKINIILRNDKTLIDSDQVTLDRRTKYDQTFTDYDQLSIVTNPGGTNGYRIDALEADGAPDIRLMYSNMMATGDERAIRSDLDADVKSMRQQLVLIDEYKQRLERENIIVPELPEILKNDQIVEDENGKLYLETPAVYPAGINFKWTDTSLSEGYARLVPEIGEQNLSQYLLAKSQIKNDGAFAYDYGAYDWHFADGTTVDSLKDGSSGLSEHNRLRELISTYTSAVNQYVAAKSKYQNQDLPRLLYLEESLGNIDRITTINAQPDKIRVADEYQ